MDAILWQFHQLLRVLPGNGQIIVNANEPEIDRLLEMGCWTPVESYSSSASTEASWSLQAVADGGLGLSSGELQYQSGALVLPGTHNLENAVAAVLAARHVGIDLAQSIAALADFRGVKRRLEYLGTFGGVRVYDDFAHHPTAIRRTLEALQQTSRGRVLAVLEPRSNSMKLGAHQAGLRDSLMPADQVWVYQPAELPWSLEATLQGLENFSVMDDIDQIVAALAAEAREGDELVVMSNGGFGGIHALLCSRLDESR
jgi:UDP-N-acetylmuramate: L-alanyl-gamma-D-glutamyl-meso-diaminopimelate ligase